MTSNLTHAILQWEDLSKQIKIKLINNHRFFTICAIFLNNEILRNL